MDLVIAARQSDLARLQAYQVGDRLKKINRKINIEYHFRQSLGDINQEDPLWQMPEKGVFTEDFRQGLIQNKWDMVVHSWKDLPIESQEGTQVVATLARADSRDLFLFKKKNLEKVKRSQSLQVFSSSPRRIYNLTDFFRGCFPVPLQSIKFESVRGNILTRIRKLIEDDNVDGLVVAKAALDRLLSVEREEFAEGKAELKKYLQQCLWQVLPLSANPTAAAQGALAVEINSENQAVKTLLQSINCAETWTAVQKERQTLKMHGGGCHQKIGVSQIVRSFGSIQYLRGETETGQVLRELSFDQEITLTRPYNDATQFFKRQSLAYELPPQMNAHYIARANALPEGQALDPDHILWASGVRTWKKLGQRGYWVHGCSDSLGEKEPMGIEAYCSKRAWAKWTHNQSPVSDWAKKIATYTLLPEGQEDIAGFSEYFWMSGSQFLRAIEINPEIIKAHHFCGPGQTFIILSEVLKKHNTATEPTLLPSYEYWQKQIKEFKDV